MIGIPSDMSLSRDTRQTACFYPISTFILQQILRVSTNQITKHTCIAALKYSTSNDREMEARALEVVAVVQRSGALDGLLGVELHNADNFDRDAAAFSLVVHFWEMKYDTRLQSRIRSALDALALIVRASHSLDDYPSVKRAFWRRVLGTKSLLVKQRELEHTHMLRMDDPEFPRLVLAFKYAGFTPATARTIANWQCSTSTAFEWAGAEQRLGQWDVSVTLRLQQCNLSVAGIDSLGLVLNPRSRATESTPDCTSSAANAANPSFRITSLQITEIELDGEDLEALARALRKLACPLDELVLEQAIGPARTSPSDRPSRPPRAITAFRSLIRAAAGISPSLSPHTADASKCGVRCLSLAQNSLSVEHFAAVCSAVQDPRSSVEELSLAQTLLTIPHDKLAVCWSWLAFGLSRPTDAEYQDEATTPTSLRRVDLSGNSLSPELIEAWKATLQSPLTVICPIQVDAPASRRCRIPAQDFRLFNWHGVDRQSSVRISEITDVFSLIEGSGIADEFSLTEGSEIALEALGVDANDWLCVLVPAYGIAWTPQSFATFEISTTPLDTSLAGQRRPLVRDLDVSAMPSGESTRAGVLALIENVGASLETLAVRHEYLWGEHLAAMLQPCPNLQHLDFEGTRVRLNDWEPLFQAIDRPLRESLRSLNLRSSYIGSLEVTRLWFALLRRRLQQPVLEELRLGDTRIGKDGINILARVLGFNKQIRVLELPAPDLQAPDEEYAQRCSSVEESFQDELLGVTPVPMRCKLAFLSVVRDRSDITPLDAGVVRIIFEFAAIERRRSIVWWQRN